MRPLTQVLIALLLFPLSACQEPQDQLSAGELAAEQPAAAEKPANKQPEKEKQKEKQKGQKVAIEKLDPSAFKEIEWTDLMPREDFEALSNPPSYLDEIEDGSMEDRISSQVANAIENASDDRYQQALVSTKVVPEMDGKAVRIPGFVVPIEFNEDRAITQFFLVPFFGACIHVPPPPPNQVIHVTTPQGFTERELYNPFWISGVIKTNYTANDIAAATYSMELQYVEMYTEEPQ